MDIAPMLNKVDLKVRPARLEDIPALARLTEASVRQLGGQDYNPQQIESSLKYIFWVDTRLLIEDGTYYVVEIDGQIVGAGGWSRRKAIIGSAQTQGGKANLLDPRRDSAKIRAFYVHPDWARQGIGRYMMNVCQAAANQAGFTRLELLSTLTGVPLYTACGFDKGERVELRMPDGVVLPAVKMAKLLN